MWDNICNASGTIDVASLSSKQSYEKCRVYCEYSNAFSKQRNDINHR